MTARAVCYQCTQAWTPKTCTGCGRPLCRFCSAVESLRDDVRVCRRCVDGAGERKRKGDA